MKIIKCAIGRWRWYNGAVFQRKTLRCILLIEIISQPLWWEPYRMFAIVSNLAHLCSVPVLVTPGLGWKRIFQTAWRNRHGFTRWHWITECMAICELTFLNGSSVQLQRTVICDPIKLLEVVIPRHEFHKETILHVTRTKKEIILLARGNHERL